MDLLRETGRPEHFNRVNETSKLTGPIFTHHIEQFFTQLIE